jgi:glutathione S-transferase
MMEIWNDVKHDARCDGLAPARPDRGTDATPGAVAVTLAGPITPGNATTMKLVGSANSPFARKVKVLLLEKSLPFEWVGEMPFAPDTRVPMFNPLGKVPALVTDAGRTLFDSRVIVEYLEMQPPRDAFVPKDDTGRIEVLRWEALADGCSDAQAVIVFERRRKDPATISADWIAWQSQKIDRALAEMARELGGARWCYGDRFTLADIAVVCTLGHLELRMKEFAWRERHPNLAGLFDRLHERASFAETVPPGP